MLPRARRTFQLSSCRFPSRGREHKEAALQTVIQVIQESIPYHERHTRYMCEVAGVGPSLMTAVPEGSLSCGFPTPAVDLCIFLDSLCSQCPPSGVHCWEHAFQGVSIALYYYFIKSFYFNTWVFPPFPFLPPGKERWEKVWLFTVSATAQS